jgi:hypothetical protein
MSKKIVVYALLVFSALLLSACGDDSDDNPILAQPLMMEDLQNQVVWTSAPPARLLCVRYATNPSSFEQDKTVCSAWMKEQYDKYVRKVDDRIKEIGVYEKRLPIAPTQEQFSEPEVWKIIWDKRNKQWEKDLVVYRAEQKKEAEKLAAEKAKHIRECKANKYLWGCSDVR